MKRLLHIIQNDPEVPPGNIAEYLTIPHVLHKPYNGDQLPEAEVISALIVLGGSMSANDDYRHPFLARLKMLIRRAVAAEVPYLGICLGGQLLAAAHGAKVAEERWEEIGNFNVLLTDEGSGDPLFRGLAEEFRTFQWHHDSFDIPAGGILLASSTACPHQAFRMGKSAWGLQFHPEVTERIIRDWCSWDSATSAKSEELVAAFNAEVQNYRNTAQQLVGNFLDTAGLVPKS